MFRLPHTRFFRPQPALLAMLGLALLAAPASATTFRVEFSGEIDTVLDPEDIFANVGIGTRFSGWFEFDPAAAVFFDPGFPRANFVSHWLFPTAPLRGEAQIGALPLTMPQRMSLLNNFVDSDIVPNLPPTDIWVFNFADHPIPVPTGFAQTRCFVSARDSTGTAITDTSVFLFPFDMSPFDSLTFGCTTSNGGPDSETVGAITSWVVAPTAFRPPALGGPDICAATRCASPAWITELDRVSAHPPTLSC